MARLGVSFICYLRFPTRLAGRTTSLPKRRVEGLVPRDTVHRQLVLGERERGWSDADRAVDRATRRFGSDVVRPASLVGNRR